MIDGDRTLDRRMFLVKKRACTLPVHALYTWLIDTYAGTPTFAFFTVLTMRPATR